MRGQAIVRKLSTSHVSKIIPLQAISNDTLDQFRRQCFLPELPAVFPKGHFADLPAIRLWFHKRYSKSGSDTGFGLNAVHLLKPEESVMVPLELTDGKGNFQRLSAPLGLFVEWTQHATPDARDRLYLAQASLSDLPLRLRDDFPIPKYVSEAGRGDVYDSSVWIGLPPTYTPLHRDPNPNLFIQLAGTKIVRMCEPDGGANIFRGVQEELGGNASATIRGDEMMKGRERKLLEREVWEDNKVNSTEDVPPGLLYEVLLEPGDGLFIPRGWWHSIKGIGDEITGSVNWWFR